MSFLTSTYSAGALLPEEVADLQSVYIRIASEPWFIGDKVSAEAFARYILDMYSRGMCDPEKLYRLCLVAAQHMFARAPVSEEQGRTVLAL